MIAAWRLRCVGATSELKTALQTLSIIFPPGKLCAMEIIRVTKGRNRISGQLLMQDNTWIILKTLCLYAGVIISPGPNFALVSRLAISGAASSAWGAILGLSLAATLYAALSMTGLAVLIVRAEWLGSVVQIVGGGYLIYLGLCNWSSSQAREERSPRSSGTLWSGLRVGALVELTNPKGITFFLGLYAAVIPADANPSVKLFILFGGFVLEMVWYGLVAILLSSAPSQAAYRKSGAWIERFAGTLLIAFGLKMLSERL